MKCNTKNACGKNKAYFKALTWKKLALFQEVGFSKNGMCFKENGIIFKAKLHVRP